MSKTKEKELKDDEFVVDLLKRLLSATAEEDDITTKSATDDSLDDGVPSIAKVAITTAELKRLCQLATAIISKEKALVQIDGSILPIVIVGDIHGQFLHLRSLFEKFGGPLDMSYLFLGDYIDRGVQGLECVCLLICLKIRYPTRIHLLRGNHEDANLTLVYGFYEECRKHGKAEGHEIWKCFMELFHHFPFAALVNKKILCMHGGLSPFMEKMEDINKIPRPTIIPAYGLATDLVWSDPDSPNPGWSISHRGTSFLFGTSVVDEFCKKNNIDLIVRGHQITREMKHTGYQFGKDKNNIITIFSAPNYLNKHNAACVLRVSKAMVVKLVIFRSIEEQETERKAAELQKKKKDNNTVKIPKGLKDLLDDDDCDTEVDSSCQRDEKKAETKDKKTKEKEEVKKK